jgi:hypothetical protein
MSLVRYRKSCGSIDRVRPAPYAWHYCKAKRVPQPVREFFESFAHGPVECWYDTSVKTARLVPFWEMTT